MEITTSRFGRVEVDSRDVIDFVGRMAGLEDCVRWVLLADAQNDSLAWLQNLERPEVALAVVSPRRFVHDYQVRVSRADLEALELGGPEDTQVLVIVSRGENGCTLNLRAPLIFNLKNHRAAQVIAKDDHPVCYEVGRRPAPLKKSA